MPSDTLPLLGLPRCATHLILYAGLVGTFVPCLRLLPMGSTFVVTLSQLVNTTVVTLLPPFGRVLSSSLLCLYTLPCSDMTPWSRVWTILTFKVGKKVFLPILPHPTPKLSTWRHFYKRYYFPRTYSKDICSRIYPIFDCTWYYVVSMGSYISNPPPLYYFFLRPCSLFSPVIPHRFMLRFLSANGRGIFSFDFRYSPCYKRCTCSGVH